MLSVPGFQKQPMLLMRENAADPRGRCRKSLPYPAEDRIFHKGLRSKFLRALDNPHTSGNLPFRNHHMQEERIDQARSKLNDKAYMTRLSNLPLREGGSQQLFIEF